MRELVTLPNATDAQTLADYLLTLKITTQLHEQPEGWVVWVCDEDRVPQAREQLVEYQRNPKDPRYLSAVSAAEALRRKEEREEADYARRTVELRKRMTEPPTASRIYPWTIGLIAFSVLVTLSTNMGNRDSPLRQKLSIAPFSPATGYPLSQGLPEVRAGQVWRVVTPIFLHLNLIHLVFNMLMLLILGAPVEIQRGPGRFLLLVLVLAVFSNVAQFYLGRSTWRPGAGLMLQPSSNFGGMSGVLYGLFGYLWMKSRFEPRLGLTMDSMMVLSMLGWFVLCVLGVVGNVANVAHGAGLLAGMTIGYVPTLWRRG